MRKKSKQKTSVLKIMRISTGLLQFELAEMLDVSQVIVSMWERKLSIPSDKRIKQLIDVARKYGFNTDFEKIKADYKK